MPRCDCLLYRIEFGLGFCQSTKCSESRADPLTFVNPLLSPYIVFSAFGSEKEREFGPNRTTSPCFACSLICSTSGRRLYTIQNLHQSVKEARNGPGYLFRPWLNRLLMRYAVTATPSTAGQLCRRTSTSDCAAMLRVSGIEKWRGRMAG
jgi:hypothetical protein